MLLESNKGVRINSIDMKCLFILKKDSTAEQPTSQLDTTKLRTRLLTQDPGTQRIDTDLGSLFSPSR